MIKLNGYNHFAGRHWETGSVCNFYAYRGVTAPHTGQPYSEALLMGVSGGIVMGYFQFAYQGYDPHVALLTRNTFDPLDTLLERLGVEQENLQTSSPETGLKNLLTTLENGLPAIVWADIFSLPYFELFNDDDMYIMYPVVVYGYDEAGDAVWIADRAKVPLTVTTGQLAAARARVKKDKFRVLTLGNPDPSKLASAVHKGIWDTIKLFTDQPPKGSAKNFGFAAYQHWVETLINPKLKNSWAAVFSPGRPMIAGLTSAFFGTIQNGEGSDGERGMYADFLGEASQILKKPGLQDAASLFREAGVGWTELGRALLPDEVPVFRELRELFLRRKSLFRNQGGGAREEITRINARIKALKAEIAADFPLDEAGQVRLFDALRESILRVHDLEVKAVQTLQASIIDR